MAFEAKRHRPISQESIDIKLSAISCYLIVEVAVKHQNLAMIREIEEHNLQLIKEIEEIKNRLYLRKFIANPVKQDDRED